MPTSLIRLILAHIALNLIPQIHANIGDSSILPAVLLVSPSSR